MSIPSENLSEIIQRVGFLSGAVGMNCTKPNYGFNIITKAILIIILIYVVCTSWLLIETIQVDWKHTLEIFSTVAIVILVTTILANIIVYSSDIYGLQTLLISLYKEYEKRDIRYITALNGCCARVQILIKAAGLLYTLMICILISFPITLWAKTGRYYLALPYYVPGLNIEILSGYLITLFLQSLSAIVGTFVYFIGDLYLIFYFVQIYSLCEIFRLKVKDFNDLFENERDERNCNIDEALIDIVLGHKLYLKYLSMCNKIFYIQISIQVFCCAFSLLMGLYLMLVSEWIGIYPILISSFVKLNMCCILGTTLEKSNEEMDYEIYNISWYNLSVPQQKVVRLMLMQSQQPNQIMLAGVLPLSVATSLQITKLLYSTFMMMVEFVKT